MQKYLRKKVKRFKPGEYTVYDNESEFREFEGGEILELPLSGDKELIGKWVRYTDGRIAQILFMDKMGEQRMFGTVLNRIYRTQERAFSVHIPGLFAAPAEEGREDEITRYRHRFLEDWLVKGLPFHVALKHIRQEMIQLGTSNGTKKEEVRKKAYELISQPWFDKALERNRLFKDKYMSIIGAFETAGITEEYLAQHLKDKMEEGTEKERINALNKTVEIIQAERARRHKGKHFPVDDAIFTVDEEQDLINKRKAIPATTLRRVENEVSQMEETAGAGTSPSSSEEGSESERQVPRNRSNEASNGIASSDQPGMQEHAPQLISVDEAMEYARRMMRPDNGNKTQHAFEGEGSEEANSVEGNHSAEWAS